MQRAGEICLSSCNDETQVRECALKEKCFADVAQIHRVPMTIHLVHLNFTN